MIKKIDELNDSIQILVNQEDVSRTIEEINKLLDLQPNRTDMIDLKSQLIDFKLKPILDESYEKAKQSFTEQDYEGCLNELDRNDRSVTNLEINSLREVADRNRRHLDMLHREAKDFNRLLMIEAESLKNNIVRDESFEKAKRLFAEQDYDGCLDALARIDLSLRNQEINELREVADRNRRYLLMLYREIRVRIKSELYDGLLVTVDELLALKSDDTIILNLRDKLIEWELDNSEMNQPNE